jgi:sialic acid synthase SpsE/mannose-6-phosphate isomerase-like protein (cupin superfamily)
MSHLPDNLVILEMANNHMGSVDHGEKIIRDFSSLVHDFPEFSFAFKLQYRNLGTFIRPDYVGRMDIKHVKRFEETRLSRADQKKLVTVIKENNFLAMCTPFDNDSIPMIVEDGFDIIKVASCSFGDWPLIEEISATHLPIVASTAGAELQTIDDVIVFFENRNKDFILQHCVGEYPTTYEKMNLNQIDFLKKRHPNLRFGFSTHEDPSDTSLVQMAIAKGAISFEKHVGCPTKDWPLNAYSSNPEQTRAWLNSARQAIAACGETECRYEPSEVEKKSLQSLQRGAFANGNIAIGQKITESDVYFAFPPSAGQLTAASFSKYSTIIARDNFTQNSVIPIVDLEIENSKDALLTYVNKVIDLIKGSTVVVPQKFNLEISHHYGLEKFLDFGLSMITLINREYCKKILICLPNQVHPEQYHLKKEETFNIIYGSVELTLDNVLHTLHPGDIITILPEQRHKFVSPDGAVLEEISSTHITDDSYYTDPEISKNLNRKSFVKWVL